MNRILLYLVIATFGLIATSCKKEKTDEILKDERKSIKLTTSKLLSPDLEKYRGLVNVYNGQNTVALSGMKLTTQLLLADGSFYDILPTGVTNLNTPYNYNFPYIGCYYPKNAIKKCLRIKLDDPDNYEAEDYLNGVTEADNDIIRLHVLCVTYFTRVEQYLGADVNLDGYITTGDITTIRKALTFKTPLTNAPWKFIEPSVLQFYQNQIDKNGILTYNELSALESNISDIQYYSFIFTNTGEDLIKNYRAFKPGDVNFDARLDNLNSY